MCTICIYIYIPLCIYVYIQKGIYIYTYIYRDKAMDYGLYRIVYICTTRICMHVHVHNMYIYMSLYVYIYVFCILRTFVNVYVRCLLSNFNQFSDDILFAPDWTRNSCTDPSWCESLKFLGNDIPLLLYTPL